MARKKGKKLTNKRQAKTPKRSQPKETQTQLRKVSANRLKQILAAHKKWLETKGKQGTRADLSGANLQEADLTGANLQQAILWGANLQEAHLTDANLQGADLGDASLQEADLLGANLQGADLFVANLQGADLREVEAVTASQIKRARNWQLAFYSVGFLRELDLPADHNETLEKKLAEMEEEKEKTATKP